MTTPARLTPRQRRSLTDDGYLVVRSLLPGADLARITARLAEQVRQTVAIWADDPSLDTTEGCVIARFGNDDPDLAPCCQHPFTRDNGPLRVIPGSHLVSEPPIDMEHGYATAMGPHPDEVKIIAPAGSLILFNCPDLWHSGTFNYSPAARLALTATFAPGPPWRPGD
jgi:hypothetical protein